MTQPSRLNLASLAPVLTLLVVGLFFSVTVEGFLRLNVLSLILQQGAALAIAAAGLTFVLLCAEIDLSVGTMAVFAACLCGVVFEWDAFAGPGGGAQISVFQTALVIAMPIAAAVVLGLLSGVATVGSALPSFIITLAMLNISQGLAKYITESQKFDVPEVLKQLGNADIRVLTLDQQHFLNLPWNAILAAVVMLVGHLILQHTRFGRQVYMTGGNREAARLAGVRTGLIVIGCLGICAFTSGLAGLVNAGRLGGVTLDQNAGLLLDAVACVVLGGTSLFGGEGGMGRSVLGVLTYTTLKIGLTKMQIDSIENFENLREFLLGAILLFALLLNGWLIKRQR